MRSKPLYMISVVSEMLDLHPQTIRQYERMGFIKPSRTEGNKRRYSDDDVERLRLVTKLTKEMGINIAGVDLIIKLYEHITLLEDEIDRLHGRITDI